MVKSNAVASRSRAAPFLAIAAAILFVAQPRPADAVAYTWTSATTGGLWSGTANWTPNSLAGGPTSTTADSVLLDTTASGTNRTVTIDSAASAGVATLTLTQTNSGTNELAINRSTFAVTNGITLGASNGGVSRIFIIPPTNAANITSTFTGGVTLNAGGVLALGAFSGTTTTTKTGDLTGNVTVQGGSLIIDQVTKGSPAGSTGSVQNTITGTLTMTSGSFAILNSTTNSTSADRRVQITQVNVTGGTFTATNNSAQFQMGGVNSSSIFSPQSFETAKYTLALNANGDQSLALGVQAQVLLRGYGVKTLSSTVSGTSLTLLNMVDGDTGVASRGTTLKLASNLSSTAFPNMTNLSSSEVATGRVDLGVDTNGNTLDLSSNAGVFTPNAVTTGTINSQAFWALSSNSGTGRIIANGFNFTFSTSGTGSNGLNNNAYTSVGPNVILESRAGSGTANTLSTGTTGVAIDPTSIFRYSGTATTSNPSTLTSTRSIGDVEVTSGALRISSLNGLQAVRVTGGTLDLGGNSLTITSGSFGGGTVSSGTLTSGTFLASSGTVSSALAGTGSLVKDGSGTIVLSGTNSYTGGTTIKSGLVQVGSGDALGTTGTISFGGGGIAYTASNTTDYSSRFATDAGQLYNVNMNGQSATWGTSLTSGGTSSLTRAGTGLLTLTGAATTIGTGGIAINGGTTIIDPGAAGTFTSTGRFFISNTATASTVTIQSGSVNLTPSTNSYISFADAGSGTATLNVTGGTTTLGLANTRIFVGNKGTGAVNVSGGLLQLTGGNPIYIGGDQAFTQNNANGTLTISGGTISIPSAGIFSIGNSGSAGNTFTGVSGTLNLIGGELQTARAITTSTLGASPATSTVNFNGGVLTALASSTTFLQGLTTANVLNGGASINTNGFDLTIAQNLLGTGTGGLTKSGTGTLTLAGANTFTGDTTVSAGTLALAASAALGQSVYDTASAGTLSFGSLTAVSLGGLKGSGNVVLANADSAAVDLSVGGSAASSMYSGTLSGAGSLTKAGSGTFTITGSQSYTGGTTISAGTLQIGNAGTTGAVTGAVVNNGVLVFNRSSSLTVSNTISGAGMVVQSGGGQLSLSGSNTYSGGTLITGSGSLQVSNASQVGSGTITLQTSSASTANVLSLTNGVGLTNPIVMAQTASNRNNITVSGSSATLSGPITITGTGSGVNIFANSVAGGTMTIAGNVTAPSSYTGSLSFRNNTITMSGTINMPGASFDLNSGGTTIVSSTGNIWSYTIFQASSNVLRLGAVDAMPTSKYVQFSGNSTGGGLDLNGFSQTIAGVTSVSGSIPAPLARIYNDAATASTLTLAALTTDRTSSVAIADGTNGGKLSLVMNSAGRTQTLSSATSSFTGGTTIVAGTIALGHSNGLGGGGPLVVNGGALDLRGFSPTVGALSGSATGVITSGTAGAATFTVSSGFDSTFAGLIENGLGTVGLTKVGSGALTLTAAQTYTGLTNVNGGVLAVNGSLASAVTVGASGQIAGSGSVGVISGAGLVGPGNSPGILTAPSVDPSGGLSFAFEFTQAAPNYSSPTSSDNDLLWLTEGTPFTGSLTSANTVSIYLTQAAAGLSELMGGFFTQTAGDFFPSISGATFQYFVQDVAGTFSYNGQTYKTLAQYDPSKSVSISTVGANSGQVMQLVVVPEPGALVIAGIGAAAAAWGWRRRRR